jgi:microcystin-dependent protein
MIGNFVQETANAPGSAATVTLAGPSPGRRGIIAAFGGGATVYLGMEDGTNWQMVEALTVAGPPQQITITRVISNSAGTTARLNFVGSVRIYSIIPAEQNVYVRPDGTVPIGADVRVSKPGIALLSAESTSGGYGEVRLRDAAAPADQRNFLFRSSGGTGRIGSLNDAQTYFVEAITILAGGVVAFPRPPTHGNGAFITPPGLIAFFVGEAAPPGWVKANGALLSRASFSDLFAHASGTGLVSEAAWSAGAIGRYSVGNGSTTFRVPDLRGEFLRAWDDARGVDGGRGIGTFQGDEMRSHAHTYRGQNFPLSPGGATFMPFVGGSGSNSNLLDAVGGVETRPRNVALLACIKF